MCLLIFAHQASKHRPLIVSANRDEFHDRPTAASNFWEEHPQLLAGTDLSAGGTWMGVTRNGRFAAVTNCAGIASPAASPRSRGELAIAFLTGAQTPHQYLNELTNYAQEYAGFNLLVGDTDTLWHFSNLSTLVDSGESPLPQQLSPGLYGLSNASLNTPWPKVVVGKTAMAALVEQEDWGHDQLRNVVSDRNLADPKALAKQGLESEQGRLLSAQFIVGEHYGTRSTTTLWINAQRQANWREQSFSAQGEHLQTSQYDFALG